MASKEDTQMEDVDKSKDDITLISSDEQKFQVSFKIIKLCSMIDDMIKFNEEVKDINLPNIHSRDLQRIITFCELYLKHPFKINKPVVGKRLEDIIPKQFISLIDIEPQQLVILANIAVYLQLQSLENVCAAAIALIIQTESIASIRKLFSINKDLTSEREAELHKKFTQVTEPPI